MYDNAPWPYGPPGFRTGALGALRGVMGMLLNIPGGRSPYTAPRLWEPAFGAFDPTVLFQAAQSAAQVAQSALDARAARAQADAAAQQAAQAQTQAAILAQQAARAEAMAAQQGGPSVPGWAVGLGIILVGGGAAYYLSKRRRK